MQQESQERPLRRNDCRTTNLRRLCSRLQPEVMMVRVGIHNRGTGGVW